MTVLPWEDLSLRVHPLTFEIRTTTRMVLPPFKGSALRGAWKARLTQSYCPVPPEERQRPDHALSCPVCYLTEWERHAEARKPYVFRPPLTWETEFPPGAQLTFGLTLFGPAWLLLPYVLSAVKAMGEVDGLGQRLSPREGRGRFRLQTVLAEYPFRGLTERIYRASDGLVHVPQQEAVGRKHVLQAAEQILARCTEAEPRLRLQFLTPTRIIHQGHLMRRFAFEPFFQRVLERLFMVAEDFGDPPLADARARLREAVQFALPLARTVQVVMDRTWWWDVRGYSSRLKRTQPLGGLMGEVVLAAPRSTWEALLVPLLWVQLIHVGKNAVKGQGMIKIQPMC